MKIENYLIEKGIKVSHKGFDFLVEAIKLMQRDRTYKNQMTTRLYPDVANNLNETATKVERGIRYAIDRAGIYLTNSEFILRAVMELNQ